MRRFASVVSAFALGIAGLGTSAGAEEILNPGDPAPPLVVSEWVKGQAIGKFEPGKTYVVEFWATWCGPCKASIPHLTKLAHQYKDVQFVGVDVWERDTKLVKPFLDEMGDKMDYNVALDDVPKDAGPDDGAMAKTWMAAAEENGIPTAFIVNDGKIAWIGHPMEMDEPLAKVTAGEWDAREAGKKRLVAKQVEKKVNALREKVFPLFNKHDYKAVLSALEEGTRDDAALAKEFAWIKFAALCNGGDVDAGVKMGEDLLEQYKDDPNALNYFFWNVIRPDLKHEPDPRVAKLTLKAAERAVEVGGDDAARLDTLAEAKFRTGDIEGAIATEEKALKIAEAELKDDDRAGAFLKQFKDRIERYKKAAAKAEK